jgi:hypothetical protein
VSNIINKINDTEYKVGIFIIDEVDGKWELTRGDTTIALFNDKHIALSWANIMYTCGTMVAQGTRELIKMGAEEKLEGKQ